VSARRGVVRHENLCQNPRIVIFEHPDRGDAPIHEVEFLPNEEEVTRARIAAEVKLLLSTPNRVLVQSVFVQPFTEDVAPEALQKADAQEKMPLASRWNGTPEFKVISSYLTCLPAPGCRLTWLRVAFELGSDSDEVLRPIAFALYPATQQDAIKITSSFEISNKLTIKVLEAGGKEGGGTEHQENHYRITTYGAFGSSPVWDFSQTQVNPEIQGDVHLLMVVATPPRSKNSGELRLSARAELRTGLQIPLITRRSADSAETLKFDI
jgi:hypothetical protein